MATPSTITKQYRVMCAAGGANVRPSAAKPNRVLFQIQNTGSHLGLFQWDENTGSTPGAELILLPGQTEKWDINCPGEAANFSSVLGTTFAVVEKLSNG